MAASPVPEPKDNNSASSIYDLLYRLIKASPTWVRIVTVLLLAGAIALSLSGKIPSLFSKDKKGDSSATVTSPAPVVQQVQTPISIQIHDGPYAPPEGSKQVDAPGNANKAPQNVDATHHVDEDAQHSKFHQDHPEDNPELTKIATFDDKDDIAYKFYSKSDRCVWVLRHENGIPISQFVKDPAFRDGVPQPLHSAIQGRSRNSESIPARASLIDALVPSASAAQLEFPNGMDESHLRSVQAGCFNGQHPGPFNWWWGPPQDQCWSPMYRQWKDGCTHYQMFNRCANAWDGRIVWTSCNPNHYW